MSYRPEYDFSRMKAVKNPYAAALKKQITIRLNSSTIDYFKNMAHSKISTTTSTKSLAPPAINSYLGAS